MKQLIALGIVVTTLGCTSKHKESDVKDHAQDQGHHSGAHADHNESAHAGHNAGAHAGHHGPRAASELIVATDPTKPVAGRPVTLKLMIHAPDGTMVKDFEVVHEEKVHLVIVRDGLDHFAHIHPAVDAKGNLTIDHTFPVGGKYRLFADYSPSGGGHATANGSLTIGGESPSGPALVENAPGEVAADGVRATISATPLRVGEPGNVTFAVQDEKGGPAKLEPYMGALGHLMFVSAGGQYVHVHPVTGDADRGTVEFEAHFAEPGLYKGWGQFKHAGQVRVIPLVVKVE